MRLMLNGPFRVFDDQDRAVTLKGSKERGLLALLVLSPGQRRTRAWLQDKLWSNRDHAQASGSLRQALSNLRKALGPLAPRLCSDRSAIWIDPPFPLHDSFDPGAGDLLDDIEIPDPEFSDWLRDMRLHYTSLAPRAGAALPGQRGGRPAIVIRRIDRSCVTRGAFTLRVLSQRIANGLSPMADLDLIETGGDDPDPCPERVAAQVELEYLEESDMAFVLLRVIGLPNRRTLWSGRLAVQPRLSVIWASQDVTRAINRTVQAVADGVIDTAGLTASAAIRKAIRRRYEFDRASMAAADDLLRGAVNSEMRGQALAWRAMIRVDEMFEFRENNAARLAEAMEFAMEAAKCAPNDPVVLGMISEVVTFLETDIDKAAFFANRAVELDDQDPEALSALGRVLSFLGRDDESHRVLLKAQHNAQGLFYSFDWDLMTCLSQIRIGDLGGAFRSALTFHRKMPFGRHGLRYLTVLSHLDDRPTDAAYFASKLRRLEPDFSTELLLGDYQPLSYSRDALLMERLRAKLA